jgi:2-polyprenyl-3-methyl-5-hydroxy-6-metoxy-1,4-benzoquinol methylase
MGDINDDNDTLCIWDHMYKFAGKTIQIHEDYDAGLGGTLFDGALLACNYLEYLHGCDPNVIRGARVIELGAGCGLPGLLTGVLGAAQVFITDIEQTMELMEENIENNQTTLDEAGCEARALELDWTNKEQIAAAASLGPFDWILAADTVYNAQASDAFVETVKALSGPNTKLLFAHPCPRHKEASAHFWGKVLDSENEDSPFEAYKLDHLKFAPQATATAYQVPTNGLFIFTQTNNGDDNAVDATSGHADSPAEERNPNFEMHGLLTCITADAVAAATDADAACVKEAEVEGSAAVANGETVESIAIGDIAL